MINFDDVIKEKLKGHNPNWPELPDHPYRILITNPIRPWLLGGVKSWGGGRRYKNHTFENPLLIVKML